MAEVEAEDEAGAIALTDDSIQSPDFIKQSSNEPQIAAANVSLLINFGILLTTHSQIQFAEQIPKVLTGT